MKKFRNVDGTVVECGVWRGGMIAGIASLLGDAKKYFLLDSFEGLPPAKDIDGQAAVKWQKDVTSPTYYDNCKAELLYAEAAMKLAGANKAHFIKGWFNETLPQLSSDPNFSPISILRLDSDWYESTFQCLSYLCPLVAEGGLIIIDDYYTWDGCARAVHDYLSINKLPLRISQTKSGTCYIVKRAILSRN
jgi:O-methyltransferase